MKLDREIKKSEREHMSDQTKNNNSNVFTKILKRFKTLK